MLEPSIELAVESFGDLDILVNNAGILRDTTIVSMSEFDFDEVLRVHMKGQAAPTHWAAAYWRDQHHAGIRRRRNLVHTSSTSGIYANPGQSNYGSAKSGIVTFSQIAAKELARYSVVSNCVVPGARTRLTMSSPGLPEIMEAPAEGFDVWSPGNVSPLVAYLCGADCPFTGETFYVQGGTVQRVEAVVARRADDREPDTLAARRARRGDEGVRVAPPAHSVIAAISSATCSENSFSGTAVCSAISFIMSPWTRILPAMNDCIAIAGSRSTISARAVVVVGHHHGVGLLELAEVEHERRRCWCRCRR